MYFLYPQDGGVYQFSDPNSQFENFKFAKNFFLNTGILTPASAKPANVNREPVAGVDYAIYGEPAPAPKTRA